MTIIHWVDHALLLLLLLLLVQPVHTSQETIISGLQASRSGGGSGGGSSSSSNELLISGPLVFPIVSTDDVHQRGVAQRLTVFTQQGTRCRNCI